MLMLRRLLPLSTMTAALIVSGCASWRAPSAIPKTTQIKKAAVVSVAAGTFKRAYAGLTVFNNQAETISIADWQVDQSLEASARKVLGSVGIQTVEATDRPASLAQLDGNGKHGGPKDWAANEMPLQQYCRQLGVDALLIISGASRSDFMTGSNQFIDGTGIFARGGMVAAAALHLVADVSVVDCSTGKPLAKHLLSYATTTNYLSEDPSIPMVRMDMDEAKTPIKDWTPEQKSKYQSQLKTLPEEAMRVTVLGLLNKR
jgi:hypothetical protein